MVSDTQRPNVLLVMTDQQQGQTVRPDHPCSTPHLERLAANGVRFSYAYTPTPLCAPARASLFSGLYATSHGMLNNFHSRPVLRRGLHQGVHLFTEALQGAGYRQAYLGKWHVSAEKGPQDYGMEEPVNLQDFAAYQRRFDTARGRAADLLRHPDADAYYLDRPGWPKHLVYGVTSLSAEARYETFLTNHAIRLIEDYARQQEPWFLCVSFPGPHDPYVATAEYAARYHPAQVRLPVSFEDTLRDKPNAYRRLRQTYEAMTREHYARAITCYWAFITYLDDQVGRILEALDRTDQAGETLVLFLSDHGDMMGAHGLFTKGMMSFEENYHVPFIIRWPGMVDHPGRECSEFVSLLDVAPTVLEAAGIQEVGPLHGRSLLPLLHDQIPADWPHSVFGQYHGSEIYSMHRMVRTKTHKFCFNGNDFDELYDLAVDPDERTNRVDDPALRDVHDDLVREMWRWVRSINDTHHGDGYPFNAIPVPGPLSSVDAGE